MPKISKLSYKWRIRKGEKLSGVVRHEVKYIDFLVDNKSIKDSLDQKNDNVGRLGHGCFGDDNRIIDKHFIKFIPDLKSGRILLYLCPECGDVDCGAITFKLETDKYIIWKDFGFEVTYYNDNKKERVNFYDKKVKFYFDKDDYIKFFKNLEKYLKEYYDKN